LDCGGRAVEKLLGVSTCAIGSFMRGKIPEALLDLGCYPNSPQKVRMMQTHTSWIFLTGEYAYKIKKPVNFGFLDYTSLKKRKKFCDEEIRLNRRLCPWLYLGVVPVVRCGQRLAIERPGEVVEYAVKMVELPQSAIMTQLVKKKKIDFSLIGRMAKIVSDFHESAEASDEVSKYGSMATVKYNWNENFLQTEEFINLLLPKRRFGRIKENVEKFMVEKRPIFEERLRQGKVRWLHGDFHSGNIFITDRICIFDCIEFNPRFSCSDTAAEIAFFVMDLDFLDSKEFGDYFVHRYIHHSKDSQILMLLDFFKSYRAYVRGKVMGFKAFSDEVKDSERNVSKDVARKYFILSEHYANGLFDDPVLVIVYGLPGVGKSLISREVAKRMNLLHLRSDIVRKELASVPLYEHRYSPFAKGLYSGRMRERTYHRMLELARDVLAVGKGCVLDATFSERDWRMRSRQLALEMRLPFFSVYCECPEEIVFERIAKRRNDPSDATREIYREMKNYFSPPEPESIVVDTSQRLSRLMRPLLSQLTK